MQSCSIQRHLKSIMMALALLWMLMLSTMNAVEANSGGELTNSYIYS